MQLSLCCFKTRNYNQYPHLNGVPQATQSGREAWGASPRRGQGSPSPGGWRRPPPATPRPPTLCAGSGTRRAPSGRCRGAARGERDLGLASSRRDRAREARRQPRGRGRCRHRPPARPDTQRAPGRTRRGPRLRSGRGPGSPHPRPGVVPWLP